MEEGCEIANEHILYMILFVHDLLLEDRVQDEVKI